MQQEIFNLKFNKKGLIVVFLCFVLTIVTQVGGICLLISLAFYKQINKHWNKIYQKIIIKGCAFLIVYLILTFGINPYLATYFGREPLPIFEEKGLRPNNIFTCLLNRNYVRLELKKIALKVAFKMNEKFPGTKVNYLDANFPYLNNFPLLPHLSHNDGKKLDFTFFYTDKKSGKRVNIVPSPIGYGICEESLPNEKNTADFCSKNGYWHYSLLKKVVPQKNKYLYLFDTARTKEFVNLFTKENEIGKIFLEPHLIERLKLKSKKIAFHGCKAVRHDDHLHIQLK